MIPQKSDVLDIDHLEALEEIEFSIGDSRWVMRSMADLYSNRELAVVREYSTNARDSHIESNNTAPIQITLPTVNNPQFVVRDFGVGMSLSELRNIYTEFGTSTKQASNDYNGMLGMGSKAAVAYTNTFTVTAVKDGCKTIGVVSRKEDYSIVLKVITTSKTSDPSGVTITVPVHNPTTFASVANSFYRFWKPGTVLVDGKEPQGITEVADEIAENLYYSKTLDHSYVVMGNVAYRIINAAALFNNTDLNTFRFVAYVDNGVVEFTPSREDLKYTQHTKDALHEIIQTFSGYLRKKASDEIKGAVSGPEAFSKFVSWNQYLNNGDWKYNGVKLTSLVNGIECLLWRKNRTRNTTSRQSRTPIAADRMLITGFDKSLGSHHKKKVRQWLAIKAININTVVFTKDEFPEQIFFTHTVSWEQMCAELPKTPRAARVSGRISGSWDGYNQKRWFTNKELDSDVKNLYYVSVKESNRLEVGKLMEFIPQDSTVLMVPENRKNKLLREVPTIVHLPSFVKSLLTVTDGPSLVPHEVKTFDRLGSLHKAFHERFSPGELLDPAFDEGRLVGDKEKLMKDYNDAFEIAKAIKSDSFITYRPSRFDNQEKGFEPYVEQTYPLAYNRSSYSAKTREHIKKYINMIYNENKIYKENK